MRTPLPFRRARDTGAQKWLREPASLKASVDKWRPAPICCSMGVTAWAVLGRVAEIVEIKLPRPRDFDMEARHEFQDATHRIRELIFGSRHARAH